jgi:hypothetical protein
MPGHIFRIASDRTSVGRVFCRAATVPPKTHGTAHSLVQQSNPRSCSSQQQAAWFAPWTKSIGVGWDSLQHPLSITSIMALPLAKGSYRQHLAGRFGCDAADTSSRAPVIRQAQANSSRNQAKTRAATAGDRPHTRPASASGPPSGSVTCLHPPQQHVRLRWIRSGDMRSGSAPTAPKPNLLLRFRKQKKVTQRFAGWKFPRGESTRDPPSGKFTVRSCSTRLATRTARRRSGPPAALPTVDLRPQPSAGRFSVPRQQAKWPPNRDHSGVANRYQDS